MSNPAKRAKRGQIREIIFDEDARREFLTGFHKRKQEAKAEAARKATARAKRERQEFRREQRRMLRERAAENAAQIEKAYGAMEGEEWTGIADHVEEEAAYEDEDVVATVAVVEDFDPDTLIYGDSVTKPSTPAQFASQSESNSQPRRERVHKKPQRIRYETKDARKAERSKQRARRTEKAELARGKKSKKRRA